MPIFCDATSTPPKRVFSPSNISAYVGNPPRELLIFSGVAEPEWDSKSNLDYADVVVALGPRTTDDFQCTSTVSLASITNTGSEFTFAADQSTVSNTPTGLELHVRIAVQGETSTFSRFSYHVHILSDVVQARITGTIRWSQTAIGDPAGDGFHMFRVAAAAAVFDPAAGGLGGAGGYVWKERAFTMTTAAPALAAGYWAVPYSLENVPLGEQVQVIPALLGGLATPVADPLFVPDQLVTLTASMPSMTGIDFELQAGGGVR